MDVSVRPHRDRSFQRSNCGLIGVRNILGAAATYLRTSVGAYWHFAALFVFVSAIIVEGTIMVNAQPRGLLELSQTIVLTRCPRSHRPYGHRHQRQPSICSGARQ